MMINYQKALDYLRMLERKENLFFTNQVAPQINCDVLQELVDKATPKKVKNKQDHYTYETYDYEYTSGNCPCCNNGIYCDELNDTIYCPCCGQKIDWGFENE